MAEYYSLEEVARRLAKSEDQIQEMVSNGELRAFRDAGSFKFRRADIDVLGPGEGGEGGEDLAVQPADDTGQEEERDELLFLIDEESGPADPDDLTLIGESDEAVVLAGDEPEGMFGEEIGLAGDGSVDDEALTAVIAAPEPVGAVGEAPAVDIFAEAQADIGVEEEPVEGDSTTAMTLRAARLRQMQEASQLKSPVMSVLLVIAFLALVWTGVVVYNMYFSPDVFMNWLGGG